MFAEIITIGDEILIGQVIDTNSAWLATQLNQLGIRVKQITSISDDKTHIFKAIDQAFERVDLVICTGGLGPTRDDITKRTLADYFDTVLEMNEEVLSDVQLIFAQRNIAMPDVNRYQALVPLGARIFRNANGTAPGMWFEKNDKVLVSMPGVPYEMKAMMQGQVFGEITKRFKTPHVYHRTILTQGVGESSLMGMIDKWESSLDEEEIKLAYLPSPGMVRLRLSAFGDDKEALNFKVDRKADELKQLIGHLIFGEEQDTLEKVIGQMMIEKGFTLATAESCTGGYIAHLITSISGSSAYFKGSVVAYDNEVKKEFLEVLESDLKIYGAVSKNVVEAMALGAKKHLKTDFAVATSGIAGPDGGTKDKPVGTVWIAIASKDNSIQSACYSFGDSRERTIRKAALSALESLRKEILRLS